MLGVQQVHGGSRYTSKTKKAFMAGVITMLLFTVIGSAWFTLGRSSAEVTTIPADIRAAATFPLYFPENLPEGFIINPSSFGSTREVVTYSINYDKERNLAVSLQPLPAAFDFDTFYEKSMRGSLVANTKVGQAHIGVMNGVQTVSLVAAKTWILVSAPSGANDEDLRAISASFKPVSTD